MKKIETKGGCGLVILSLLISGAGQMVKGEVVKGLVMLLISIVTGVVTYGIGAVIMGIISAVDAAKPFYKCPKCMSRVDAQASICKHCRTEFTED